mgnify:CR=1 FL=1
MGQARHLKKDGPSTRFAVALRDWHVYAIRNHLRYGGLPARVPEGQILKEELGPSSEYLKKKRALGAV